MSKFLKIFVALAAIAAFATPAFAIEADFGGFLQVRGLMLDNMDGNDDNDDQQRGIDQRFRLYSTFALNENVKAVFKTEIDSVWGKRDLDPDAGKEVGSLGADAKGEIEVKNIYLDFNLPTLETNVKAGTQYFYLGRGFINGDDATGLQVRYTPVRGQSLAFFWIKATEGDFASSNDESDYYQVQYDLTSGDWHIAPYLGYAYDPGTAGNDSTATFLGLDIDGKLGPLGLAATAIVNDWEDEESNTDGNGLVLWAKGTYQMGATGLSLEAAYYGDEDAGGNFVNVNTYNNFSEIITGGQFDGRGGIGQNQTVTASSLGAPYEENYMYVKLGAVQKYGKSKVSLYLIHAEQAEDEGANKAITYGQEVDGYYDYEVVQGLTFTLAGAYLLADDDFGAGDDAWKLGTALTYQF